MPEKGWKIITVRKELHRKLVDLSTKEGVSIGELIESRLTSQLTGKLRRMEVEVSELTSELTSQKEEATSPNRPTKEPREQGPYRYTLSTQDPILESPKDIGQPSLEDAIKADGAIDQNVKSLLLTWVHEDLKPKKS